MKLKYRKHCIYKSHFNYIKKYFLSLQLYIIINKNLYYRVDIFFYYFDISLQTRIIYSIVKNFSGGSAINLSVLSNYIETILKQLGNYLGPIQSTNERAGDRPLRFVRNGEKAGNSRAHLSQKSIAAYVRTSRRRRWRRRQRRQSKLHAK